MAQSKKQKIAKARAELEGRGYEIADGDDSTVIVGPGINVTVSHHADDLDDFWKGLVDGADEYDRQQSETREETAERLKAESDG